MAAEGKGQGACHCQQQCGRHVTSTGAFAAQSVCCFPSSFGCWIFGLGLGCVFVFHLFQWLFLLIYLFLVALGLRCCARTFL